MYHLISWPDGYAPCPRSKGGIQESPPLKGDLAGYKVDMNEGGLRVRLRG